MVDEPAIKTRARLQARSILPLLGLMLFAGAARGQGAGEMEALNFRVPLENYPPPNEAQVKTLLEGAKVQPQSDGRILLTGVKLMAFSTNGSLETLAETRQCVYDSSRRVISSPGHLQLQSAEGRFRLEGRGFQWTQAGATLILSNEVHTIVRESLLASHASAGIRPQARLEKDQGDIEVFSDNFRYDRDAGRALYRGRVRVTGTNLRLTAQSLTLGLPPGGHALNRIVAEGDVAMERDDLHFTGDRAVYTASNEVITVTGHPAWRMGRRQGHGDELVVDRADSVFRANGNAYLKFPRSALDASLLLSQSPASPGSPESTNRFIQITSGSYKLSSSAAVFRDRVLAREFVGDQPQGTLECETMSVSFVGSNQVRNIVAQDHVRVEQGDARIAAAKAIFSGTNSAVEFSGNPTWRLGARAGSGDRLVLNRAADELRALGHARIQLPASQVRIMDMNPPPRPEHSAGAPDGQGAVEITCDDYKLTPAQGVFRGNVKVRHQRGKLSADLLTLQLSQRPGAQYREAVATKVRNRVEIVWVDTAGRTNYAWSDKAVYVSGVTNSVTNDLAILSGNCVVINPQHTTTADRIILDRIHGTVYFANERSEIRPQGTNAPELFHDTYQRETNASAPASGPISRTGSSKRVGSSP